MKKYVPLEDMEIYKLSRELSGMMWIIYEGMTWQEHKIIGDQAIRSCDSVGANIAEGYARYGQKDKIKFYIYSRGSLLEFGTHWLELMHERKFVDEDRFMKMKNKAKALEVKLNNYITSIRNSESF